MAISADSLLPSGVLSPLRGKQTPSFGPRPPMVSDSAVASQQNNLLAGAAGAGSAAMQGLDRAGISRGRGQQFRADMAQADADAQATAQSNSLESNVADANARASQAYENTMRSEQVGNAGLLENLRVAANRESIAKQGWQQDMKEAIRRGQFSMDSIYLDKTPLLDSLLR